MSHQTIYVLAVSDSAGETVAKVAQASIGQFEKSNHTIKILKRPFINSEEALNKVLNEAVKKNAIFVHTLVSKNLIQIVSDFSSKHPITTIDALSGLINELSNRTQSEPAGVPGTIHSLNKNYFERINAIEFAVKYDDGKDPKGFLKADILLLGISRTSKTPLSLFLANKNLKVANLPLLPDASIPEQVWKVDPSKIVGLTNDPKILNNIRKERMKSYGLNPDTPYSDIDKIKQELDFSKKLYDQLGCMVINVADLSIEETASMILSNLNLEDKSYYK